MLVPDGPQRTEANRRLKLRCPSTAQLTEDQAHLQNQLDGEWERLLANEPSVVLHTLEGAFEDNEASAVAVNCEAGRVTVLMLMDGEDSVPERKAVVTPSGKPSLHKFTKTERNDLYRGWVYSNVLATVREALAVAPGIQAVTVVVLRSEPATPNGESSLSPIYVGTMTRDKCAGIAWNTPDALNAALDFDDLMIETKGQTKSLVPIQLSARPVLAALVQQFRVTS